mmetsp:Transcript_12164/g.33739  ORF Transcript_12164/g.33739 Transcript_12164/m.33739 type:complete len:241 (+) Transcript_12164:234-956(+)
MPLGTPRDTPKLWPWIVCSRVRYRRIRCAFRPKVSRRRPAPDCCHPIRPCCSIDKVAPSRCKPIGTMTGSKRRLRILQMMTVLNPTDGGVDVFTNYRTLPSAHSMSRANPASCAPRPWRKSGLARWCLVVATTSLVETDRFSIYTSLSRTIILQDDHRTRQIYIPIPLSAGSWNTRRSPCCAPFTIAKTFMRPLTNENARRHLWRMLLLWRQPVVMITTTMGYGKRATECRSRRLQCNGQ